MQHAIGDWKIVSELGKVELWRLMYEIDDTILSNYCRPCMLIMGRKAGLKREKMLLRSSL